MLFFSPGRVSVAFAVCFTVGLVHPAAGQTTGGAARAVRGGLLPGTKPNVLTTIQGNALNANNGSMPGSVVRLRDARAGRIVGTQTTDPSGLFTFRAIDPGSYIVEVMAPQNSLVMATSQVLSVNAGESISTVVKLPFSVPTFGDMLGQTTRLGASQAVVSAAASTGILTSGPLDVCVSGPCQ